VTMAWIAFIPWAWDWIKAWRKTWFKSFKELKEFRGATKFWYVYHHIVEQHADNIIKFWAEKIHSVMNTVPLPHIFPWSIHRQITWYYNSLDDFWDKWIMKVRNYVKNLNFDDQYNFWINVIKKFWWSQYLK